MTDKIILKTQEQVATEWRTLAIIGTTSSASASKTIASATIPVSPQIIGIQNLSTVLSDTDVANATAALQTQLNRDWFPVWGSTAALQFYTRSQLIPSSVWPLYILDTSDIKGALGYHYETNLGRPYGRIFAKDCLKYNANWTVTLSHELLEMIADPHVNLTVFNQYSSTTGRLYAFEVCDACENDRYGYKINNILVSDFVWPSWFDPIQTAKGTRYHQTNIMTRPFQILPGGYISIFDVSKSSGWINLSHTGGTSIPGYNFLGKNRRDRKS